MKTSGYGHVIWIFKQACICCASRCCVRRIKDADRNKAKSSYLWSNYRSWNLSFSFSRPISYPTKNESIVPSYDMTMGNVCMHYFFLIQTTEEGWDRENVIRSNRKMMKNYGRERETEKTITNVVLFVLMRMIFSFGSLVFRLVIFIWCNATDYYASVLMLKLYSISNLAQKYVNFNGLRDKERERERRKSKTNDTYGITLYAASIYRHHDAIRNALIKVSDL